MSSEGSKIPEEEGLENPLWRFACRFWQSPEARETCLELQNLGWSVTRILCAAWLASTGRRFSGQESSAVTDWRRQVTVPLRTVRKHITKNDPCTDRVRESVAKSELEAERVELALAYQALASETGFSNATPADLGRENFLAAAPTSDMDDEVGGLLDALSRELSILAKGDDRPC